ncbi:MAG: hypothetical protein ACRC1K_22980 [Planctomycetia bacterium]
MPFFAVVLLLAVGEPPDERSPAAPFDAPTAAAARARCATATGLPAEFVASVGQKMLLIPAGRFSMGPNGSTYAVTLTKPFHVGATETTLGQYRRFRPDHHVAGAPEADAATGEQRLPTMRGGFHCIVVAHDPGAPTLKADNIGFRVVRRTTSQ